MLHNMLVQSSLVLESSLTVRERTLQLLLLHHVQGAGGEQHGAAPTDVGLVGLQHDVGTVPVPEHNLAGESLDEDL